MLYAVQGITSIQYSLMHALLFGSLISAVDPVAVSIKTGIKTRPRQSSLDLLSTSKQESKLAMFIINAV